jgi:hypothetical protein
MSTLLDLEQSKETLDPESCVGISGVELYPVLV